MTDREQIAKLWSDAWTEGLWAAPWSKSVEGLTAAQAAWAPPSAPGVAGTRHSIWQHVMHMVFWGEDAVRRLSGGAKPAAEQLARENFPVIADTSEPAWAAARRRLAESQRAVGAAMSDGSLSMERLQYLLPHDCYHFGQINLIRAMLGLKPIE